MKVSQVYALMNKYAREMWGKDALSVKDLSSFASFGDAVLGSAENRDNFLGVVSGDIAKTVVRTLDLDISYPSLMVERFVYGTFLRKLTVRPILAQSTESWNVGDADFTPTNFKIDKPDITEKMFSGINTFEFDLTIPDRLFRGSFRSPEDMSAFLSAMTDALSKSVVLYVNYANRMCLNLAIARKLNSGRNVLHLLTEYNATVPSAEQISDANIALINPAFLRFAGKRVLDMLRYMREPNAIFNEDGEIRATRRENAHVFLLGEFTSATERFLEADVYNRILTSLPNYEEIIAYGGLLHLEGEEGSEVLTTLPTFEDASTINVKIGEEDGADVVVNTPYVIGAIFDRQTLGTTLYDERTAADRNNRNEYTNYTNIVDIGFFIDESEQGVVFVID